MDSYALDSVPILMDL